MTERATPNFTYEQHLGCPVCGHMLQRIYERDRRGRYRRSATVVRRPEKMGPWAADDVLEDVTESSGAFMRRRSGRVWAHKVELECSGCSRRMSRGQAVAREFSDGELPHDFWDPPVGEYPDERPAEPRQLEISEMF